MQKKVLAINDISCVGRCSLTVALPIISSCGIECSIMPTAILSTHTGGFSGYTFTDFTNQMLDIANHWKSLNLNFDSIYTGFLGSKEQIDIVKQIVNMFKNIFLFFRFIKKLLFFKKLENNKRKFRC